MSFYEALSQYYDVLFPAAPAQAAFVKSRTKEEGRVLDVAAGAGNLAVVLAEAGFQVTAVDIDPAMAERMQAKSCQEGRQFEALKGDMREVGGLLAGRHYETVLCVGNSIVHLASLEEIAGAAAQMKSLLAPGGTLILQVVNYDRIIREHVTELPLLERSHGEQSVIFRRTYEHTEEGKINFHGRLTVRGAVSSDSATQQEWDNTVQLLALQSGDLMRILQESGFTHVELFGSFQGEAFGPDSPALIAVART